MAAVRDTPTDYVDNDTLLEADRARNDQKLKSRFEHIFRKYEHDFTGVGDEIDMVRGDIVVNNGHLEHMRDEVDPGQSASASSRFVQTFQDHLGHESSDETTPTDSDAEEGAGDFDTGDEYDDNAEDAGMFSEPGTEIMTPAPSRQGPLQPLSRARRPIPRLARLFVGEGTPQRPIAIDEDDDTSSAEESREQSISEAATPTEILAKGIRESAAAVKSAGNRRPEVDPDAIQALGLSIANQLARLMGGSARKKTKKRKSNTMVSTEDPIWSHPRLPHNPRQKRRRSESPVQQSTPFLRPDTSPGNSSLWSVEPESGPGRKRRRPDLYAGSVEPSVRRFGINAGSPASKRCWNCSLTSSSHWIDGPHGQALCAPCGQYYQHHGRMKGFDSPTPAAEDISSPVPEVKEENEESASVEQLMATPAPTQQAASAPDFGLMSEQRTTPQSAPPLIEKISHTPQPSYQANTSRPVTPMTKAGERIRFTPEEDALIIKLRESDRLTWEAMGERFPNRSAGSLQVRYSSYLHKQESEGRALFDQEGAGVDHSLDSARASDRSERQDHVSAALTEGQVLNENDDLVLTGSDEVLHIPEERRVSDHATGTLLESSVSGQYNVDPPGSSYGVAEQAASPSSLQAGAPLQTSEGATTTEATTDANDLVTSPKRRYSQQENDLIIRLRDQGVTWSDMAKHFPGRASTSLQQHYSNKLMGHQVRPRNHLLLAFLPRPQSSATPLHRRAVGNRVRSGPESISQAVFNAGDREDEPQSVAPSQQLNDELIRSSCTPPDQTSTLTPPVTESGILQTPTPRARFEILGGRLSRAGSTAPLDEHDSAQYVADPDSEIAVNAPFNSAARPMTNATTGSTLQSQEALEDLPNEIEQSEAHDGDRELDTDHRPDLAWLQLIRTAFEATKADKMKVKEIYKWVEANYDCSPDGKWKIGIRNELARGVIASRCGEHKNSGWQINNVDADMPIRSRVLNRKNRSAGPPPRKRMAAVASEPEMSVDALPQTHPTSDGGSGEVATDTSPPLEPVRPPSRHVTFNPEVIVTTPITTTIPRQRGRLFGSRKWANSSEQAAHSEEFGNTGVTTTARRGRGRPRKSVSSSEQAIDVEELGNSVARVGQPPPPEHSSAVVAEAETEIDFIRDPSTSPKKVTSPTIPESPQEVETSRRQTTMPSSSSPLFAKPARPMSIYKTPKTAGFPRLAQSKSHSTPRRKGIPTKSHTRRSLGDYSVMRLVETPVRDLQDPEEDELAS